VYFQDTDAGGVVFHGTYLDFLERARTEWLRALGFDQRKLMREDGVLFIVRALELAYLKPALLDDLLAVSASIEKIGRAQLTLRQEVRRGTESLVRALVNLACVSADRLRPAPIPERVHAALWDAAGTAARHPGVRALEHT
jgi:acyl-CoA thioester hydrolase